MHVDWLTALEKYPIEQFIGFNAPSGQNEPNGQSRHEPDDSMKNWPKEHLAEQPKPSEKKKPA